METNRKLKIVVIFFKAVRVLAVAFTLLTLGLAIHSEYHPEYYSKVILNNRDNYQISYMISIPDAPNTPQEWESLKEQPYYWNLLATSTKARFISEIMIMSILTIIFLSFIIQFLQSFNYPTFFTRGISYLRKIEYSLIAIIVIGVIFMLIGYTIEIQFTAGPDSKQYIPGSTYTQYVHVIESRRFTLPVRQITFLIICYIFELVFREGKRLQEENELTV